MLEANHLTLDNHRFLLSQCIHEVTDILSFSCQQKGIELITEFAPDLPLVAYGDDHRLRQILLNLIGNSIKFTATGKVTVRVRGALQITQSDHRKIAEILGTTPESCQDYRYFFEIEDTGIGMTSEEINRLFQPFHQADHSISRKYGGTGLGLVISKRLIEMMGGWISVQSTPHGGSLFQFSIQMPVAINGANSKMTKEKPPTLESSGPLLDKRRVLIVEDHLESRKMLEKHLVLMGAQTQGVEMSQEAITLLQTGNYDLAFIDWQLPDQNGGTVAETIRAWEAAEKRTTRIYLIAVSAFANLEDQKNCKKSGMDDFLSKPISETDLINAVQKYLAARL